MSDLDVLASLWPSDPTLTEGWTRTELPALLESGDLEIHADDFFTAGANEVQVQVRRLDGPGALPARTIKPADNHIVVTVPSGERLEVTAQATVGPDTLQSGPREINLLAGQDRRLDLCSERVALTAAPPGNVPADGTSRVTVTARVSTCDDAPVANRPITFSITPAGVNHASLGPLARITDVAGVASTTFTAGTEVQEYTITAVAQLSETRTITGRMTIQTVPRLSVAYVWQQTNLEWTQSGSTRWTAAPPGMPDCTDPGVMADVGYCIDNFQIGLDPARPGPGSCARAR